MTQEPYITVWVGIAITQTGHCVGWCPGIVVMGGEVVSLNPCAGLLIVHIVCCKIVMKLEKTKYKRKR